MIHNKSYFQGVLFALVTCLCFGIQGIVDKIGILQTNNPFIFSTQSSLFSLLSTTLIALFYFKGFPYAKIKKSSSYSLKLMIAIGVLASGLFILLRILGLKESTGTFAGLSQGMTTSLTALLAWIFLKEKLSKAAWGWFALIVISMYFVSIGKIALIEIKQGDKFILSGTIFLAAANIFSKKAVQIMDPVLVSLGRFFFGFIFLLAVSFLFIGSGGIFQTFNKWEVLSGLILSINVITFNIAIKKIGITLAASLLMMAPVLTMVLEYFLLGYQFTVVQVVAAFVVIVSGIGIIFANESSQSK